jgi:hypothetical protein
MRRLIFVALVLAAGLAGRAQADVWDTVDDAFGTAVNELSHGSVQDHNLGGGVANEDFDWFIVNSQGGHSYEFRVEGQNTNFYAFAFRYAADGTTSLPVTANLGGGGAYGVKSFTWEQASVNSGEQFINVTGYRNTGVNTPDVYTARFYETTLSIPRYNCTGGQTTRMFLQNATAVTVAGSYNTHTVAGAQVFGAGFSVAPLATVSVDLCGAGAAGTAGTIVVTHDGGYGGLAGKAVALEPATGFSFDTPAISLPN